VAARFVLGPPYSATGIVQRVRWLVQPLPQPAADRVEQFARPGWHTERLSAEQRFELCKGLQRVR
jgi:hypothetical protein